MTGAAYPFAPDPNRGPYARVYSGRVWHYYHPDPAAVTLEDVAHHLAHKGRWFGAMRVIYTVAQHCVLVSRMVEDLAPAHMRRMRDFHVDPAFDADKFVRAAALTALHHDDDEAFLPDIAAPLKQTLTGYPVLERTNRNAIFAGLGVRPIGWDLINQVDRRIREDEVRALASEGYRAHWDGCQQNHGCVPLGIEIEAWDPQHAKQAFLNRHRALTGQA